MSLSRLGYSISFAVAPWLVSEVRCSRLAARPALRAAAYRSRETAMNVPLPCRGEREADASGLLLPEEVSFPTYRRRHRPPVRGFVRPLKKRVPRRWFGCQLEAT